VRGLTKWLQQHGFTYHKPVGVPAKADGVAQKNWIAWYQKFSKKLQPDEKILFMDGVHPAHAVRFTWRAGSREACEKKSQPTAARSA